MIKQVTEVYSFTSAVVLPYVQKYIRIHRLKDLISRLILRDISPFVMPLVLPLWTSRDVRPGFQSPGRSPGIHVYFIRFTSGATPADHLVVCMAAEHLLPTYFFHVTQTLYPKNK